MQACSTTWVACSAVAAELSDRLGQQRADVPVRRQQGGGPERRDRPVRWLEPGVGVVPACRPHACRTGGAGARAAGAGSGCPRFGGLLNDQKGSIAQALPAGLASELGSTGLFDGIADRLGEGVSTTARTARAEAARPASVATPTATGSAGYTTATGRQRTSGGGSWLRWLLGLLLLALLAWLAWQHLLREDRGGGGRADDALRHGR
jgi:hypothetical protein